MLLNDLYQELDIFGGDNDLIKKSDIITYNGGILINDMRIKFGWDTYFESTTIVDGEHKIKLVKTDVFPHVNEKEYLIQVRLGKLISWSIVN